MIALAKNTALIVIDVQQAFDNPVWGQRNNAEAEERIAALLELWREEKMPLVHVMHCNPAAGSLFQPGSAGVFAKPEALPLDKELVLYKRVNSAFIGTDLEERLQSMAATSVVICGMTTDHCCSTSARMAANLGFVTYFVSDATATFERTSPSGRHYSAEEMHESALTSLNGEFAEIVTVSDLRRAIPNGKPC